MMDDMRHALRGMARTPGFTAIAVLMIALGTGANAAMFSVIDAVLLRSPFSDPDHVAIVAARTADGRQTSAISLPQYRALTSSATVFEAIAAIGSGQRPILTGLGDPRRFNAECVTGGMFAVLGASALMGRTFSADDDRAGSAPVVVLSYAFWQREMGGAPDAIGRVLGMNGAPTTVIGVMPRGFGGPYSRNNNDGWMPAGVAMAGGRSPACSARASVTAFARLKPGLTFEMASSLATDAAGIARLEDWQGRTGARLQLIPIREQTLSDLRTPLLALVGAVGLVLLIACANVANLQMERIFGRRVELAVRMALGATRARIISQTLTENLVLSLAGGVAGTLAARWTLDLIVGLMPANMPYRDEIALNGRVLGATLAVACAAGIAVGLMPALQGTAPALMNDLRASSRSATSRGQWVRRALVVAQVALSLTLLVGATLMIATFRTLRPSDPGFAAADKLIATVRLQGTAAASPSAFFDRLLDRVRAAEGVRSVSASTYVPMSGTVTTVTLHVPGRAQESFSGVVTPNYFPEMEIPILRGRGFSDGDGMGATKVAVVNETLARRAWPDGSALGQVVDVEFFDKRREPRQIVGVTRDTRFSGSDLRARPEIYMPFAQATVTSLHVFVRASNPGDPQLAARIRSALSAVDPTQVLDRAQPMQELLDSRVSTWRFGAWLLGVFAAMALLLAAIGLAASIAWWVSQRTREIGLRMALGAPPAQVTRMFLRQGLALAVTGVALGLGGAAASTRFLQSWLYGITPLNPAAFAGSAAGLLAGYLPARRAARVDPLVTLRAE
jgi:putative ABC transport system permease protein